MNLDEKHMRLALDEARKALEGGEFPVDTPVGMENSGVVSATEELTDLGEADLDRP